MTEFGRLDPDGTYTVLGRVDQAAMLACPHNIIAVEHYRPDSSCRCDDPHDPNMAGWGYTWSDDDGQWIASDDEDESDT